VLNYLVLTSYDWMAVQYIKRPLPYRWVAPISFIGYAFSNNVGLANLAGTSVRYHLYSARELTTLEIAKIIGFCHVTFWLGFFAVGGVVFIVEPLPLPPAVPLPWHSLRVLGGLMLAPVAAYLAATVLRPPALRIREWEIAWPSARLSLAQVAAATLDWVLAAGVLYVLLPESARLTFPSFVGVFMLAQVAGILSHVPAGLGVFEMVILAMLGETALPKPQLFGTLLAYRAVYYLAPLGAAALLLAGQETLGRLPRVRRAAAAVGQWFSALAPHVFGVATFCGGVLLVMSAATPAVRARLAFVNDLLPLGFIEASHFLSSLAGVGLLLLARGLQRRLNGAWHLSLVLLGAGVVLSIFRGLEYEEASILAVVFVSLLPCRKHFYRKSSLLSQPFTPGWTLAIAAVVACSTWLGLFAFKHVEYSSELWWQFSLHGDAPRFLRATVGVVAVALFIAIGRLLRPARPDPAPPSIDELAQAGAIVDASPRSYAHLAMLGDKALLWNDGRTAFIMYGVEGRSWVALGDPVGPAEERSELAWRFRELCDEHEGWPVFYQVAADHLPLYLELGLTMLKLGEEARVALGDFSIDGHAMKSIRSTVHRARREGCAMELVESSGGDALLAELKAVSDDWLVHKSAREKGFSLGRFHEPYLRSGPLAIVRAGGRIVAFCNILAGGEREELSIDLMRYRADAPPGVMDFLFVETMQWGQAQGYRWFNLGMAPLAGLEQRALAPLWSKLGAMVYRHGEHFYNFRGLRQYKEKYHPVWEPRYLSCPGSLALPRILANVATLIGGGLRGVLSK
jgi:phosphatidylglycerol lysyltransferase